MKEQKGFTLIELMVVMAIIAILATAGITSYGGYIKKARDATRLEDMRALENVAIASFNASGQSVTLSVFRDAVRAMNNGVLLTDPIGGAACLDDEEVIGMDCEYQYHQCENGGYVLRVSFESNSNFYLYAQDKLNSDAGPLAHDPMRYDIGNCDTLTSGGGTI